MANKTKKGDTVVAICGKDKGKRGQITTVNSKKSTVVVDQVNIVKRHLKANQASNGGIVEISAPMPTSKVMLVCPKCDKPTRVGFKHLEDGTKVRFCKKCSEVVDK
jgi:large subunit ribosomal protein L24